MQPDKVAGFKEEYALLTDPAKPLTYCIESNEQLARRM